MALTLRESIHVLSDPANLDASVCEVFGTMLGLECECAQSSESEFERCADGSLTAVVGFGGILSGACVLSCDERAARMIVGMMAGTTFDSVDEVVKDGIGEICNMVAGTWKGNIPGLAANCGLSMPAVITGRDYRLHVQAPEFKLRRIYHGANFCFEVTIVCDGASKPISAAQN